MVLPVNRIDKVRSGLEKLLKKQYISSVEFSFKYIGLNKKGNKDMIKKLWPNIFDEVRKASPFVYIYGKDIEHIYIDDRLKIKAPDEFIYESFKDKNLAILVSLLYMQFSISTSSNPTNSFSLAKPICLKKSTNLSIFSSLNKSFVYLEYNYSSLNS